MQLYAKTLAYTVSVSFGAVCLSGMAFGQWSPQYSQAAPQYGQPGPPPQYSQPVPPEYGQPVSPQFGQPAPQPQDMPPQTAPAPLLSPQQLDNLVAPVALYPDALLGQVLAASTYPLELMEAQQWLQQHPDLRGWQALDAAKQMNWDGSVQAMIAFPDVLRLLTQDVRWTTDLGNAFLAQQADVMDAVQRLRFQAQQNGRLSSTPQEVVRDEPGPGQGTIEIQPANPQMIYVPVYSPYYVWGPPVVGAYPPLWYPSVNLGSFFTAAIAIGSLFTGLLSWSGWGWALSWLTHGLFLNGLFFSHFGFSGPSFGGARGAGYSAVTAWVHNPVHRLGVPYPNRMLASGYANAGYGGNRFAGSSNSSNRLAASPSRDGWQSFGGRSPITSAGRNQAPSVASNNLGSFRSGNGGGESYRGNYRGETAANGAYNSGISRSYGAAPQSGYRSPESGSMGFRGDTRPYDSPAQSYRGYSGGAGRPYEAPAQSYRGYSSPSYSGATPRSYAYAGPQQGFSQGFSQRGYSESRGYSAPRSAGGGGRFSEPKSSGHFKAPKVSSHSSGGHSGGGHSKSGHKH